jgi:hypothetical protein
MNAWLKAIIAIFLLSGSIGRYEAEATPAAENILNITRGEDK